MEKLLWGGKLNTRILRMDLEDELGDSQDSGGSGGSTPASSTTNVANSVELNVYKIDGTNQELIFSDYVNPVVNEYTISAEDVGQWGNGTFKARVGGVESNTFHVQLSEAPPVPTPAGAVNAAHYRFAPQRNIIETVISEVVGIDNGKVDVPVQFNMNYSVYNIAPPGSPNPGNLSITQGGSAPAPQPVDDSVDQPMVVSPEEFSFPPNAQGGSTSGRVTSEPRTIVGITQPVEASVSGNTAKLQVNDGMPSAQPQMVDEGDVVRLSIKGAGVFMPIRKATLNIGNFTTMFITTMGSTAPTPTPTPTPSPTPTPPWDKDYGP